MLRRNVKNIPRIARSGCFSGLLYVGLKTSIIKYVCFLFFFCQLVDPVRTTLLHVYHLGKNRASVRIDQRLTDEPHNMTFASEWQTADS